MKILELVKMNGHFAYVVDNAEPLIYREERVLDPNYKRTELMLIGEAADGRMDFLTYRNWSSMRAFAGRELSLQMQDGTVRTVKDVWWSEGAERWAAANKIDINSFSYNTLEGMIDCCVFYGSAIQSSYLKEMFNEFCREYPDYQAWEYNAWHDHCRKLHEEQYRICPKCHTSVHHTKAPNGLCPKCSSEMLTLEEHYNRMLRSNKE